MAIYAKVRRMRLREGLSISEIARRTSLSRNTIKAWLRDPVRSEMAYRREAGPKKLDGHIEWLRRAVETDARRPRKERRTALFLYVSRMVNLTTLAPDIVAAIVDDTLPNHVTLFDLAVDPPALWDEQQVRIAGSTSA